MNQTTANKTGNAAGKSVITPARPVVGKLISWGKGMIARHQSQVASLGVYRSTREDGRSSVESSDEPARGERLSPAPRQTGNVITEPNPPKRLAGWIASAYKAHEARVAALRVYDRTRDK